MRELIAERRDAWPPLPLESWKDTYATLHMWMQVVGKIRLKLAPYVNHWWQVPFYVTARGLTTSAMPYQGHAVAIDFDFLDHQLVIQTSAGDTRRLALRPQTVAAFHDQTRKALAELGVQVDIWTMPVEIEAPIRFELDEIHATYDPDAAQRVWRVLLASNAVFNEFRGRFLGKSSPVHFFWGSFDLAVTRFSGRRCPQPPPDPIGREGYSHEVISVGFWPGGRGVDAVYYAYAAPPPAGFDAAKVQPDAAYYHATLGEFLLPYEAVCTSSSPRDALLAFCQSTYDAGATLGDWDRTSLEQSSPPAW